MGRMLGGRNGKRSKQRRRSTVDVEGHKKEGTGNVMGDIRERKGRRTWERHGMVTNGAQT